MRCRTPGLDADSWLSSRPRLPALKGNVLAAVSRLIKLNASECECMVERPQSPGKYVNQVLFPRGTVIVVAEGDVSRDSGFVKRSLGRS
ncbi:MAG: hypothetical protein CM1200mP41_17440 [Gammaproteobacteria bacterium]|nr:MAG: hypothetical protein CM1200mP41_17440 [Gammaproteobacteria bacterium]